MTVQDLIRGLRFSWVLILVFAVLGVGGGLAYSLTREPIYESQSELFVSVGASGNLNEVTQGGDFAQQIVASYARVAVSPAVLGPVGQDARIQSSASALASQVQASAIQGTVLLEISVTDPQPRRAADVANLVAHQLAVVAPELSTGADERSLISIKQIAPAEAADAPTNVRPVQNAVLLGLAGLVVGLVVAALRARFRTRLLDSYEAAALTGLPVLAAVPAVVNDRERSMLSDAAGFGTRSSGEAIRKLRTNLAYTVVRTSGSKLLITSAVEGEGKSTIAIQTAVTFAEAGARTLLVDADLRKATAATKLGLPAELGLAQVLAGQAGLADVLQTWGPANLDVLPAGDLPPNPAELLQSKAMVDLLDELSGRYERIVIDCAPLLPVTDAAILAPLVTGTVLVAAVSRVRRGELEGAVGALRQVGANVVGLVVNMVSRRGRVDADGYYIDLAG